MTVQYNTNFDSETPNAVPVGWTTILGAGLTTKATAPVSGAQAFAGANDGDASLYTGLAAIGNQAIRIDQKVAGTGVAQLILMGSTTGPVFYLAGPGLISSGNYAVTVYKYPGYSSLGATGNLLTGLVDGDIIHHEFRATVSGGTTTLSGYVWKNADAKPGSLSYSFSDSSSAYTTGRPGIRMGLPSFAFTVSADNLVWTDSAGGEGYYDSAASAVGANASTIANLLGRGINV